MTLGHPAGALLLLAVSTTAAGQGDARGSLHRFTLPNGLQIVVVERHTAPVAMVLVAVRAGATVQAEGERGLAHLFEHLLFRSYGYGSPAFGDATADLDGQYNGAAGLESVHYYLLVPSERAVGGIALLGRLMRMESFKPRQLAEERKIVLDELERSQSDPEDRLERRVSRELWGPAWHRRDVGGDSASLMAITPDQLTDAHARYYRPDNALLVVTGDVRPADVLAAASAHFGPWHRRADPLAAGQPDSIVALTGSRAVILPRAVPDVTIHIALLGPSVRDDTAATHAAAALVEILNDPHSAFQERLVGSGLFQHMALSYTLMSDASEIAIVGKTTAEAPADALLALIQQIDSLDVLAGVTDEDLAIARRRREVADALEFEAAASLAPSLADWWGNGGLDYYLTYREGLNRQRLDDLRRFAQRYMVRRPKVIGVMGPTDAMARLAEWLRGSVRGR